jgi:mRNA-degrading endonuclease RelE of RelBE toxin-antitoxin system
LKGLQAGQRKQILNRIERQLTHEPTRQTRNRKPLAGLVPPWEYVEPVWELRIGEYRVFYDVDEAAAVVIIRAIRHKPPHKTTEEIL